MMYTRIPSDMIFGGGISMKKLLLSLWITASLTTTASSNFTCPVGSFQCGSDEQCVEQKYQCDYKQHCRNGDDEAPEICHNDEGWVEKFLSQFNREIDPEEDSKDCQLKLVPSLCKCEKRNIMCKGLRLGALPSNISTNVKALFLQDNHIQRLTPGMFSHFTELKTLQLSNNSIAYIPPGTFDGLSQLKYLYLKNNKITSLDTGTFGGMENLWYLSLQENNINSISGAAFPDSKGRTSIDLRNNNLSYDENDIFPGPIRSMSIDLTGNHIRKIGRFFFQNISSVDAIILENNEINSIHKYAFTQLGTLVDLNLANNMIRNVDDYLLKKNRNLEALSLANNPVTLTPKFFANVPSLTSLNLTGLNIPNINTKLFSPLTKLEYIYFKVFRYCRFAPHVRVCLPNTDGISSIQNLLDMHVLRYCIWIVAIVTCLGNVFVMVVRCMIENENSLHSLFIKNLCAADFMMGVYLIIVASHDVAYRDRYNEFADSWMNSWKCKVSGFLAMTSCEVSILILTFMSVERCVVITQMFSVKKLGKKSAYFSLVVIWLTGLTIAFIPIPSLKTFYGTNGVCFPLHIHEPYLEGWKYSAGIFLGLNFAAMLIVTFSYIGMFLSVMKTRRLASTSIKGDRSFAKRIFLIVATDAACWIPIIIVKCLAFGKIHLTEQAYGWLAIFALPINSALNPLLYSLTTFSIGRKIKKALMPTDKKGFSSKQSSRISWPGISVTLTLHDHGKIIVTREISRNIKIPSPTKEKMSFVSVV